MNIIRFLYEESLLITVYLYENDLNDKWRCKCKSINGLLGYFSFFHYYLSLYYVKIIKNNLVLISFLSSSMYAMKYLCTGIPSKQVNICISIYIYIHALCEPLYCLPFFKLFVQSKIGVCTENICRLHRSCIAKRCYFHKLWSRFNLFLVLLLSHNKTYLSCSLN